MVSPTFGLGLFTVLLIDRSAACTLISAESELSPVSGSVWATAVIEAVLVMVEPPVPESTVAVMVSVAVAELARVPTDQIPVMLL